MDEILNEFHIKAEWDELVTESGEMESSIPVTPSIEALIPLDQPVVINIDDFPPAFVPPSRTTSYPNYLRHNHIAVISPRSLHAVNQHQQKWILRLIRRRCVLTQVPDILRLMRPVRPDLRRNVPYVLTQRRVLLTSRLPQILPLIASSS